MRSMEPPRFYSLSGLLMGCFRAFFQFLALGIVGALAVFAASLSRNGVSTSALRGFSFGVVEAMAALGLMRAAWIFVSYYGRLPKARF